MPVDADVWRVLGAPTDFDRLRTGERFAAALTLGRVVNMMRSALMLAAPPHVEASESAASRARMSATLLLAGLLSDDLTTVEYESRHPKHLRAYRECVLPITRDSDRHLLTRQWLKPLRDEVVFHYDQEVTRKGLELMHPAVAQQLVIGSTAGRWALTIQQTPWRSCS